MCADTLEAFCQRMDQTDLNRPTTLQYFPGNKRTKVHKNGHTGPSQTSAENNTNPLSKSAQKGKYREKEGALSQNTFYPLALCWSVLENQQ